MSKIKLSCIAAMAQNRVIGRDNALLWHIPEDFRHFKRTTMGKPMIMGRKTFESLPGILPGRAHIVVSRSTEKNASTPPPNASARSLQEQKKFLPTSPLDLHYVKSIDAGIALGKHIAEECSADEAFIIGGGELYKQTLPQIERLYLTLVHRDYEGDAFFPEFDWDEWSVTSEDRHKESQNTPAFTIFTLKKKSNY